MGMDSGMDLRTCWTKSSTLRYLKQSTSSTIWSLVHRQTAPSLVTICTRGTPTKPFLATTGGTLKPTGPWDSTGKICLVQPT